MTFLAIKIALLALVLAAAENKPEAAAQPRAAARPTGDQPPSESIDWARAQQLLNREKAGEKLSAEEQAYLDHAQAVRRQTRGRRGGTASQGAQATPSGSQPTSSPRRAGRLSTTGQSALPPGYVREKDIRYGTYPEDLLDVYYKKDLHGAPVMVYIHGGGWVEGGKSKQKNSAEVVTFLAGEGCVVVSADYRLVTNGSSKNCFPAAICDGACAVAWAQRNAMKYGGDPTKIIIGGHSAGAHITALIAYDKERNWLEGTEYKDDKLKIAGFIGWSGPYHWASVPTERVEVKSFLADKYGPGKWGESEPVRFVSRGGPPGLIITGDSDSFANIKNPQTGRFETNSYLMAEALAKAGAVSNLNRNR